jgi:hypothetical protein
MVKTIVAWQRVSVLVPYLVSHFCLLNAYLVGTFRLLSIIFSPTLSDRTNPPIKSLNNLFRSGHCSNKGGHGREKQFLHKFPCWVDRPRMRRGLQRPKHDFAGTYYYICLHDTIQSVPGQPVNAV